MTGGNGADTVLGESNHDDLDGGHRGPDPEVGPADDVLDGGAGNDLCWGGEGNDLLIGQSGADELRGEGGFDTLDGGEGHDLLRADRAGETLSGGEDVDIGVPDGESVAGTNLCGPSAIYRFLRSYQFNVSFGEVVSQTEAITGANPIDDLFALISRLELGTVPSHLLETMWHWRPETQIERASPANFDKILGLLRSGKPVIALINSGGTLGANGRIRDDGYLQYLGVVPRTLHYVVLTGFDERTRQIRYMDFDGVAKSWSFTEFMARWSYRTRGLSGDFLTGQLGCKERTIIW